VQLEYAAWSREHWNVLGSVAENVKVALVSLVAAGGPELIVVFGATVSTVHVQLAGVGSTFWAVSFARTWNVWVPSARLL
jgi:hypothetical protein